MNSVDIQDRLLERPVNETSFTSAKVIFLYNSKYFISYLF